MVPVHRSLQTSRQRDMGKKYFIVEHLPTLEKGMAIHFSILAWRIPWTEESGGLQSMGSHRVGHD